MENLIYLSKTYSNALAFTREAILEDIPSDVPWAQNVTYHLLDKGSKWVRPLLVFVAAKSLGQDVETSHIALSSCVECIHNASLLHDDVVDNSTQRRGVPTAHTLWQNKTAILAGDFLFSKAFMLLSIVPEKTFLLEELFSICQKMAQGELMQLYLSNNPSLGLEEYLSIATYKTAYLFSFCSKASARLLSNNETNANHLEKIGEKLGLMFQIGDDLLDYDLTTHSSGKNYGEDFFEGKVSFPLILCYARAQDKEKDRINYIFSKTKRTSRDLRYVKLLMDKHNTKEEAFSFLYKYWEEIQSLCSCLPFPQEVRRLSNYCLARGS